uniref:Uncharacterized protein n=1 Tax=Aegilops tauschii TaxID=37682 RepID=N1R572_AEGTA
MDNIDAAAAADPHVRPRRRRPVQSVVAFSARPYGPSLCLRSPVMAATGVGGNGSLMAPKDSTGLGGVFARHSRDGKGWKGFPVDLSEGVLKATCMQALGQAIDIRLGLAIDSPKATLAVKRSLACEMVKCWQQAHESIADIPLLDGWGEKHRLFVKWKHMEAKAAAYYYHVLILDESNTEKSQRAAVAALQSAEESLRESRAVCEAFHSASPCRVDGEHEMSDSRIQGEFYSTCIFFKDIDEADKAFDELDGQETKGATTTCYAWAQPYQLKGVTSKYFVDNEEKTSNMNR